MCTDLCDEIDRIQLTISTLDKIDLDLKNLADERSLQQVSSHPIVPGIDEQFVGERKVSPVDSDHSISINVSRADNVIEMVTPAKQSTKSSPNEEISLSLSEDRSLSESEQSGPRNKLSRIDRSSFSD